MIVSSSSMSPEFIYTPYNTNHNVFSFLLSSINWCSDKLNKLYYLLCHGGYEVALYEFAACHVPVVILAAKMCFMHFISYLFF
jgi:hypothetical protein